MDRCKILLQMAQTFSYITAGMTISAAIFITVLLPGLEFTISLLWEIIAIAAVCTLGNLIYYKEMLSKGQMRFRIICHYSYINLVVFTGALLCGWVTPGILPQFLVMLLLVAVVYATITFVIFRKEMKVADTINQELRNRFPSGEDEEEQ